MIRCAWEPENSHHHYQGNKSRPGESRGRETAHSKEEQEDSSMKRKKSSKETLSHFPSVPLADAHQRAGKHHKIVTDILSDLAKLDQFSAVKIILAEVGKKKADLRAALLRAAKKKRIHLATSSDDTHLYVFRSS
jgi:hypothetical protein